MTIYQFVSFLLVDIFMLFDQYNVFIRYAKCWFKIHILDLIIIKTIHLTFIYFSFAYTECSKVNIPSPPTLGGRGSSACPSSKLPMERLMNIVVSTEKWFDICDGLKGYFTLVNVALTFVLEKYNILVFSFPSIEKLVCSWYKHNLCSPHYISKCCINRHTTQQCCYYILVLRNIFFLCWRVYYIITVVNLRRQ